MKGTRLAALAATVALVGCQDMGLEENVPLAEAETMATSELLAAVHAPTESQEVVMAGQLWVSWGAPGYGLGPLRPVGSAHGATVYARYWDQPPFDALFVSSEEGWQALAPIFTGSTASALH